jgi:hypothetical protein
MPTCSISDELTGRGTMQRWLKAARGVCCAGFILLCCPGLASAGAPCDEYDPAAPSRSARIRLTASDFLDESRDEMRTFVATDSVGAVTAAIVSANPRGIVRAVSAVPEISRFSPYSGEELKGIAVTVLLAPNARPGAVTVNLRQVCARYFRNSFLYY